jgi:hypothetical protein
MTTQTNMEAARFPAIAVSAFADNSNVANCVNCGAPLRIESDGVDVCDYCGSQYEGPVALPYLDVRKETTTLCPGCSTPLSTSNLEGLPLLSCRGCFGMLINMELFAAIIDAVRLQERRLFQTPCHGGRMWTTVFSVVPHASGR